MPDCEPNRLQEGYNCEILNWRVGLWSWVVSSLDIRVVDLLLWSRRRKLGGGWW